MLWKCKYCPAICERRTQLFKHYRLKHGSYARTEPLPCLYQECKCTFKSLNALHSHLSRFHTRSVDQSQTIVSQIKFRSLSCEFLEPCTESEYFTHLRSTHLKVNHKVVKHEPDISQMVQRWPALFTENQVCESVLYISCLICVTHIIRQHVQRGLLV